MRDSSSEDIKRVKEKVVFGVREEGLGDTIKMGKTKENKFLENGSMQIHSKVNTEHCDKERVFRRQQHLSCWVCSMFFHTLEFPWTNLRPQYQLFAAVFCTPLGSQSLPLGSS